MAEHVRRIKGVVAIALILGAASATPVAKCQSSAGPATPEMALSNYSAPSGLTGDDVIAKMLERNRLRNEQLQRYSAVRTYEIRKLDGKLAAQEVVRVDYQAPDKKTFEKTSEKGSGIVRHLVFDRLIQSESETSSGQEHHDSAITTTNYAFLLAGEEEVGPYHCFVLEATPKRKDKYLFEGKIWIDAADFAIVKIAGHPAKKPSFWINRADFVRQYQRIDGFWLPYRDETAVEVKIYGRRVFTVDHQQYVINADSPLPSWSGETGGNLLVAPSATLRPKPMMTIQNILFLWPPTCLVPFVPVDWKR
jgi:outer membrane lipoprotein-sorting protein